MRPEPMTRPGLGKCFALGCGGQRWTAYEFEGVFFFSSPPTTSPPPLVVRSWIRAWTAEENRHGDLLNKYLWCTGRVNMTAVERTIQYLIGTGMDPKTENNPYMGYIYTSFQERATKV